MIDRSLPALALAVSLLTGAAHAQEAPPETPRPTPETPSGEAPLMDAGPSVRIGAEIKTHFRASSFQEHQDLFPFPPSFLPPGETAVFLRTVARGPSFEISSVNLTGEANFTPHIQAGFQVNVLDLYDRNPTSSDDRISLRQAWVRFGRRSEALERTEEDPVYVQMGKAPRFTKQMLRSMESYGLWGTAVGRFEEIGIEAGATLTRGAFQVYGRVQIVNGNPLFIRDPNLLAGDNGTPERVPGNTTRPISGTYPIYQSGFPILYDAKAQDLNATRSMQTGFGLGVKSLNDEGTRGFDLMAWRFNRTLQERPAIRGSFYLGDLTLLHGVLFPLATSGDSKVEYGFNLHARRDGLRFFGQYVNQDIAGLARRGFEAEAAWNLALNDVFLSGETPVLTWIRPVLRYSRIDNRFSVSPQFPAPSVGWDWKKFDVGVRVGVIRDVDLTAEYTLLSAATESGKLKPNEFALTLRAAF